MNRILGFKNLTKKIAIFFFVFLFLILSNTKISNAKISPFGYGAATTTCADDINKCGITPVLNSYAINNPNYKLENTDVNLDGNFGRTSFKINDFNISLDDFIKERLYRGEEYGYFGNSISGKFNSFETAFLNFTMALSPEQQKSISLLTETLYKNLGTQETKLIDAKFITKSLAENDHGYYDNKSLQIATLLYYYLKIYLTIDKYITINKSLIPVDILTKLVTLNEALRSDIYFNLYKDDRISRSDECTKDGTNLDQCTIFSKGIFTVTGLAGTQDQKINAIYKVNQLKLDASKYDTNANNTQLDPNIANADPNTRKAYGDKDICNKNIDISWWFSFNPSKSTTGCSFGAVLINTIIQGINSLVNIVVSLAGALFDWIYQSGVIDFKSWVNGSGAYIIYKTIILSLLVSVMMFFVFYLIIRRLIDDDGENMNKILPKLILTALFVYFSFTITGWIIDQSNIVTIYLYRSITHHEEPAQPIGKAFKNILSLDNGGANSGGTGIGDNFGMSIGNWDAVPFTLGQLVVSIVGVFILFQGAILILSRTIILLLSMIFSPIMLLPEGLTEFTDKYKKIVTDNFTGNVLLGPVFMFLVLLAFQIGDVIKKWIAGNNPTFDSSGVAVPPSFLGGIISSVLVIVVLQLAISASKSLSGSMGEKLGGVIGKYAGGAAFGGGAKILRNTIGRGAAVAKDKGWMMGKPGSGRHKFMTRLYDGVSKSTFDARNTKAAEFSGASIGKGSTKNYNDSFKARLYKENKYHNGLDEEGKQRNISRLKNLGSVGDIDSKRVVDNLEKKWKPSINERLNNDSDYNKKFEKAHNEKDVGKRKTETEKVINEHFKENGQGAEHFSKEINKPENNKIKQEYDRALNEKDPVKRKEALTKVIADIDKKTNPSEGSLTQSLDQTRMQSVNSNSGPKPTEKSEKVESMDSLRTRLQAKYSKDDVNEYRQKRMNLYQDKSLKEAKEKQDAEIAAEKEKNGGYIPSVKNVDDQNKLAARLKEKFSTRERMENGKIITESSPELLDQRKRDLKTTQRNIERQKEDQYQQSVLEKAKMDVNVDHANNQSPNPNRGSGPELSNSSVSGKPPTINLDTSAENKIEIPLTNKDGKPNIIQGDIKTFSQN